jgi:hypothetical protein
MFIRPPLVAGAAAVLLGGFAALAPSGPGTTAVSRMVPAAAARPASVSHVHDARVGGPLPTAPNTAAAARLRYCDAHNGLAGGNGVVSHFTYCEQGAAATVHTHMVNGVPEVAGRIDYRVTIVGSGFSGRRQISFDVYLDEIAVQPDATAASQLTVQGQCTGLPVVPSCLANGARTDTVAGWRANPYLPVTLSSPPGAAAPPDFVANGTASMHISGTIAGIGSTPVSTRDTMVRFDSAPYLAGGQGAIFSDVVPHVAFTLTDHLTSGPSSEWGTANHILDAVHNPAGTVPMFPGKVIPGGSPTSLLTRLRPGDPQIVRNGANARATCYRTFPPADRVGRECDEFPFATTAQGAFAGNRNYSVRPVSPRDNQVAGNILRDWYSNDRILAGDQFYVTVTP